MDKRFSLDDRVLPPTPTQEQFAALNSAYQYFKQELFDGQLPGCILNFSRKKRTHGFMAPRRWRRVGEQEYTTHEISLTPYSLYREPVLLFSTLVHEQCHLWQWEFGTPSRSGYHNHEWAEKMEAIGLMPSSTGQPGGKRTGQRMTHYIIPGERYEQVFQSMPGRFALPFTPWDGDFTKAQITASASKVMASAGGSTSVIIGAVIQSGKKTKYTCPGCGANVWGKPSLSLICGDCQERYSVLV
jgi:predicted SprT family Zn-dependent metalloprotease